MRMMDVSYRRVESFIAILIAFQIMDVDEEINEVENELRKVEARKREIRKERILFTRGLGMYS